MYHDTSHKQKYFIRALSIIIGILGLGTVIIVHELGHWIMCQLYGVSTPLFSIGFGPVLFELPLGETIFQIALLPFGGYVSIDPVELAAQSYVSQITILCGGIIANIATGISIFVFMPQTKKILNDEQARLETVENNQWHAPITSVVQSLKQYRKEKTIDESEQETFVGPVGIIHIISKSIAAGPRFFFSVLASLNISIALFNLVPLPFLDGGKMVLLTIKQWIHIPDSLDSYVSFISVIIIIALMAMLSLKDIRGIIRRR